MERPGERVREGSGAGRRGGLFEGHLASPTLLALPRGGCCQLMRCEEAKALIFRSSGVNSSWADGAMEGKGRDHLLSARER